MRRLAILQLTIQFYSQDQHLHNPEWASVCAEVLGELGLDEAGLPELTDVIIERYHQQD